MNFSPNAPLRSSFERGSNDHGERLNQSVIGEMDGFGRALRDTGPAFNALFRMDRM